MSDNKIALGTVQFGMNYGVSNKTGKVQMGEIERILEYCKCHGISVLDTAQGYGDSERILGEIGVNDFDVITKLIGDAHLETSLDALKIDKVYALMFHRENECSTDNWKKFENYKQQGMADKIGVSAYSPDILLTLIQEYPIDIVQFPMNILDQRFLTVIPELSRRGIEIHTRSTFLQGLLLMEDIPKYFDQIKSLIDAVPHPRLHHSIQFCKEVEAVDRTVFGVTCLRDLEEIYDAYMTPMEWKDYSSYSIADERYIDPSRWEV